MQPRFGQQSRCRDEKHASHCCHDKMIGPDGIVATAGDEQAGDDCCRDTAAGEAAYHLPIDSSLSSMQGDPGRLGEGGKDQVSADGGLGNHPEEEHEDRGHKGAAADAGQSHEESDEEARSCRAKVHVQWLQNSSPPLLGGAGGW